jgi:5-methylcytosine-specific restriction protein A
MKQIQRNALYKTARWKRLREAQLARRPFCERHRLRGQAVEATVVHHRVPHKNNAQLFFDPTNLESVCKPCHDGHIQEVETIGYSRDPGSDGWPDDPLHPANR